jgi:hypothetical protein
MLPSNSTLSLCAIEKKRLRNLGVPLSSRNLEMEMVTSLGKNAGLLKKTSTLYGNLKVLSLIFKSVASF